MPKVLDSAYFDYASTTPMHPQLIADMDRIQKEYYFNADALYEGGQRVHDHIDASRSYIASYLGVKPQDVFFTSGASESNSAAIKGLVFAHQHLGKHIITTPIEHSSVLNTMEQLNSVFGYEISYVDVDASGKVIESSLLSLLRPDTVLVSMMAINNETGTINDVDGLSALVKTHSRAFVHVDGVQALTKHTFSFDCVDAASFSAHKIYGMKGSGLLIKKHHIPFVPLVLGGQQQAGVRGGTYDNVAAILFAKTIRLADAQEKGARKTVYGYAKQIVETIQQMDGVQIHSDIEAFPYIINMSFESLGSEIILNALGKHRIYVSAQSTCNSKSQEPSHVLQAMGIKGSWLKGSIRISLSHLTTQEEIDLLCQSLMELKNYEL